MKLVILHNHFRPGGVRRVIELATPHLAGALRPALTEVVVASGERPDADWLAHLRARLTGARVACWIEPALGYLAEQSRPPREVVWRLRRFFSERLGSPGGGECVVWAHNQGLARNLLLTRELARHCFARDIRLVLHHHDWWFGNRWQRWPELQRCGFRSLRPVAETVFIATPNVRHATINRSDFTTLRRHLGCQAGWLPNLMPHAALPGDERVHAARRWLDRRLGECAAPIWLVPSRLLRRKNFAEALLLTRWLRPEAWLVTTGGVSSADEQAYFQKLGTAAREHGWRLHLGVLAGGESHKPTVPDLFAVSEAVLLTSLQEGFGLPYLEAAAARRPMIARRLPNVAPDLQTFGFRLPQAYGDLFVPPALLDWERERARQARHFNNWLRRLPRALRRQVAEPAMLASRRAPHALAFSRLTLTAQLEVLAQPAEDSWQGCAPLNPFLKTWRWRAGSGKLKVTPWPRMADRWLGGRAYAARFARLLAARCRRSAKPGCAQAAQRDFMRRALAATNHYPLLWHTHT